MEALFPLVVVIGAFAVLILIAAKAIQDMHDSTSGRVVILICAIPAVWLAVRLFASTDDRIMGGFLAVATLFAVFDVCCLVAIMIAKGLDALGLIES